MVTTTVKIRLGKMYIWVCSQSRNIIFYDAIFEVCDLLVTIHLILV